MRINVLVIESICWLGPVQWSRGLVR